MVDPIYSYRNYFALHCIALQHHPSSSLLYHTFLTKHKNTKKFENHLNPAMLVFIGKLLLSANK